MKKMIILFFTIFVNRNGLIRLFKQHSLLEISWKLIYSHEYSLVTLTYSNKWKREMWKSMDYIRFQLEKETSDKIHFRDALTQVKTEVCNMFCFVTLFNNNAVFSRELVKRKSWTKRSEILMTRFVFFILKKIL